MNKASHRDHYRDLFVGLDEPVPLLGGARKAYINLDNAASTPPFRSVQQAVNDFQTFYSSVHRGTGFKSQLSTYAYDDARAAVIHFVGGIPDVHTCIFGKNTTEAINKLARRFTFLPPRDIVLTTAMEHHSNDLPWRAIAKTIHVGLTPDGRLDERDFDEKLSQYRQRVALVAITGASNVTGYINPIHRLAEKAHAAGAHILVDCAQLAPHRAVGMLALDDPAHLDFVAISAHKMYAPFGTGALIGRRDIFEEGDPDQRGGGTVEIVTLEDVVWSEPPEKDEAGSPNTIGAIAMAVAVRQLETIGMDVVAHHETTLTSHTLAQLREVPGIRMYGDADPAHANERLGVIPLMLPKYSHFQVAAILGYEFGIGVRSGCFCAHPYILHLLNVSPVEADSVRQRIMAGDRRDMPGLIRASLGLYNTIEEIDALADALKNIAKGKFQGNYAQDTTSGEFFPVDWHPDYSGYFSIHAYTIDQA
jgi:selenocysteine lyase/cysteine desulfurase